MIEFFAMIKKIENFFSPSMKIHFDCSSKKKSFQLHARKIIVKFSFKFLNFSRSARYIMKIGFLKDSETMTEP